MLFKLHLSIIFNYIYDVYQTKQDNKFRICKNLFNIKVF